MMIVSRLLYAALCLVLAAILLISGSGAILALLAALLLLPLAMLAVNLCGRKHVSASFRCPVNAKKGETAGTVRSRCSFPAHAAAASVQSLPACVFATASA